MTCRDNIVGVVLRLLGFEGKSKKGEKAFPFNLLKATHRTCPSKANANRSDLPM